MARINLLPWREQLREERKREFFVLLMGVVIIAAGIVFLIDRGFRGDIRYQQARNLPATGYLSQRTLVRLLADSL